MQLNPNTSIDSALIPELVEQFGSPLFVYDGAMIIEQCKRVASMPHTFGYQPRYAVKANPLRAIVQLIEQQGFHFDVCSVEEAERLLSAGISPEKMMLTSRQVAYNEDLRTRIMALIEKGAKYNICSPRQLHKLPGLTNTVVGIRLHPDKGTGESATRDTGSKYSSFGFLKQEITGALDYAAKRNIRFTVVHSHVGSGGDPAIFRENIRDHLRMVEQYFSDAHTVNFGGGFRIERMPGKTDIDVYSMGEYAQQKLREFYVKTGRTLKMEVEPGTYIVGNSGFMVTRIIDRRDTGVPGFDYIITDGGMNLNTRPILYEAEHPFYVISESGELVSSEFNLDQLKTLEFKVLAGPCCETGDTQSFKDGHIYPRRMGNLQEGFVVVGGAGAYCTAMNNPNYCSFLKPAEVLILPNRDPLLIVKQQTVQQMVQNELGLR